MRRFWMIYPSLLLLVTHLLWQAAPEPVITSPVAGQALQGIVQISGTTAVEGFQSAVLSFAYGYNPTDTWFKISVSDTPVQDGVLAEWDTTRISDGDYTLRLTVKLADGGELVEMVESVRVRNYTPIEADTPTPTMPTPTPRPSETLAPTVTPSITPTPTVTPVIATSTAPPPNPAELSQAAVLSSIGLGILATAGLFAVFGLLYGIRRLIRRS
jgi:hypothetical protein